MRFRLSYSSFPLTGRRQKCYLEGTVSPGTPNTAFRRQPVVLTHLTDILLTNAQLLPDSRDLCLPLVAFITVRSLCNPVFTIHRTRDRVAAPETLVWLLATSYWFPVVSSRQFANLPSKSVRPGTP
jgi:hypothetical protein